MKSWEMVLGMSMECWELHNFYVVTNVPLRHEINYGLCGWSQIVKIEDLGC